MKIVLALVCIVVISFSSGAIYVNATGSTPTFTISSGVYPGAPTYTVFTNGVGNYYAKNAYGVIDYSSTSASTVIQDAINVAELVNGTVYVSSGVYPLSTNLTITQTMTLMGAGSTGAKININNPSGMSSGTVFTGAGILLQQSSGILDVGKTLKNFGMLPSSSQSYAIYVYGSSSPLIIEGVATFGGKVGLKAYSMIDADIRDCSFSGAQIGFEGLAVINNNIFTNVAFNFETQYGVLIYEGAQNTFLSCLFQENSFTAPYSDSAINLNYNTGETTNVYSINIENCYFEANQGDSIDIGNYASAVTITNCYFSSSYCPNVIYSIGDGVTISNNFFDTNAAISGGHDINVTQIGNPSNCYIFGNTINGGISKIEFYGGALGSIYDNAGIPNMYYPTQEVAYNVYQLATCNSSITQGTWTITITASQVLNFYLANGGTQNDQINYTFDSTSSGTFTLSILGSTTSNSGISTVYIDGVSQGTLDWYSGSSVYNVVKTLSITLTTSGLHTLSFKMATQNGSSNGYYLPISAWWL